MFPDWLLQAFTLCGLGGIGFGIKRIIDKLDAIQEHGAQTDLALADCVKWEDLEDVVAPLRTQSQDHEKRIVIVETTCRANH